LVDTTAWNHPLYRSTPQAWVKPAYVCAQLTYLLPIEAAFLFIELSPSTYFEMETQIPQLSKQEVVEAPKHDIPEIVIEQPSSSEQDANKRTDIFQKCWISSTADSNLTLHGFRRFKTTHLLNLRMLEHEIAEMDNKVYEAGLSLGIDPTSTDRLGLKYSTTKPASTPVSDIITPEFTLKLRGLLQEYGMCISTHHPPSSSHFLYCNQYPY
jgi:hypothetical protein